MTRRIVRDFPSAPEANIHRLRHCARRRAGGYRRYRGQGLPEFEIAKRAKLRIDRS